MGKVDSSWRGTEVWGHISLPLRIVTPEWVTKVVTFPPPITPGQEAQPALGQVGKHTPDTLDKEVDSSPGSELRDPDL